MPRVWVAPSDPQRISSDPFRPYQISAGLFITGRPARQPPGSGSEGTVVPIGVFRLMAVSRWPPSNDRSRSLRSSKRSGHRCRLRLRKESVALPTTGVTLQRLLFHAAAGRTRPEGARQTPISAASKQTDELRAANFLATRHFGRCRSARDAFHAAPHRSASVASSLAPRKRCISTLPLRPHPPLPIG